jgi:tetratricopeptide (TPR) repeat protein
MSPVAGWREPVPIPTYLPEEPVPFPLFLDHRVYQGSCGRVYPLPFHTRISTTQSVVEWDAVHLENRWLRVMILPQLGGRIHMARDRVRGYEMFFRNDVIKPALVGLAGPWIAGGVEFNWPQHHRPATFLPVDVEIEFDDDGSVTVWCSDHDPMHRLKGMHGVRLRPERAVLEVVVRLYNRNELPQTFLWWANVAVRADEHYQSFFPDDVTVVADHARRAITAFPAADRQYYGIDYPSRASEVHHVGGDLDVSGDRIDWFRNIPVPTSYMCLGSAHPFFGGFDHRARAGFVHVGDPHVVVGKKQWTWGNADFGHTWCRQLTDDGADYIELMAGAFSNNQPDFSHLVPGETKVFTHTWFPIHDIGPVRAASLRAALAVTIDEHARRAHVGVAVVEATPSVSVELADHHGVVLDTLVGPAAPGEPICGVLTADDDVDVDWTEVVVRVRSQDSTLVAWKSTTTVDDASPTAASSPPAPAHVESVEELALIGMHLDQYRHATRSPEPYWIEACRRDPGHLASSVGLAMLAYRRSDNKTALGWLQPAVDRLLAHNNNPVDATALYLLAVVLEALGQQSEAYRWFGVASWDRRWRAPAGYRMARLDAAAGRLDDALHRLADVRRAEPEHLQAAALAVIVLRRLGDDRAACDVLRSARALDPMDAWLRDLDSQGPTDDAQVALDVAIEYAAVGDLESALRLTDLAHRLDVRRPPGRPAIGPLAGYFKATWLHQLRRDNTDALASARNTDATLCFPNRLEDARVLETACADPTDGQASLLLGHWLYAHQRHDDAMRAWQRATELDANNPIAWRNLGFAIASAGGDLDEAARCYDRALSCAPGEPTLVYERDRLEARRGGGLDQRLEFLESNPDAVAKRDDTMIQLSHLLISVGRLTDATALLTDRQFQPWEGGEGEALAVWERLCLHTARRAMANGQLAVALQAVDRGLCPPDNLGETRHPLASAAHLWLARGDVLAASGARHEAQDAWERAAAAHSDFVAMAPAAYSTMTFHSVVALRRLDRWADAEVLVTALDAHACDLAARPAAVDYFATSLPAMALFDDDPTRGRDRLVTLLEAQVAALNGDPTRGRRLLGDLLVGRPCDVEARDLDDLFTPAFLGA